MIIPTDWSFNFHGNNDAVIPDNVRGICPHCRHAVAFSILANLSRLVGVGVSRVYSLLQCNAVGCGKIVYVVIPVKNISMDRASDGFCMYPLGSIDNPHPAVPRPIAEDWVEAQKAMQAGAPKAAAVMCRRVLYGAILDKKCKEHPLHEGLKELIQTYRLPAIFDDWLVAVKDDGHDAAHPHRSLEIDPTNAAETMEYTAELLRFLYIEPYEFQQRKARNAAKP